MVVLQTLLSQLRGEIENTAFSVSAGESAREVHKQLIRALVTVAELENTLAPGTTPKKSKSTPASETEEIQKVERRLKLWAKRPTQINHRILKAYLSLTRNGCESISETELRQELGDEPTFDTNYLQMKMIADKNHGKVFEQEGSRVTLWEPIRQFVDEFESAVFGTGE